MIPLVKLLRLPARDRRLFFKALCLVVAIRLQLWLIPLRRIVRRMETIVPDEKWMTAGITPEEAAQMVRRASRAVPCATCLTQALATGMFLRLIGLKPRIRIGVAKDGGLKAHAWVECDGRVIIGGGALEQFTALGALDRLLN